MPESTDRDASGSAERRLARLLDTTALDRVVPYLPPETLHLLVRHRGLDVSAELVASATPVQLTALADLDLWRSVAAGLDERLDQERFGEWMEMLVDLGGQAAARIVATLDRSLVVAGLSAHIRVFDPGTFEPTESSDDERPDRREAVSAEMTGEIGGYVVCSRKPEAWDAITRLLLNVEIVDPDCFHELMRECQSVSDRGREIDGLDDLLAEPDQLLHDVALSREDRRTGLGYVTAADARAFLQAARQSPVGPDGRPHANPVAVAYLRDIAETHVTTGATADAVESAASGPPSAPEPDLGAIEAIVDLVAEAGLVPGRPRALLEAADTPTPRLPRLRALMDASSGSDAAARSRELAFLANALMAGSSMRQRAFTVREASDAAASICHLGLELWDTEASFQRHDLIAAFEAGWTLLYERVSLPTADRLLDTVSSLATGDTETASDLGELWHELARQRGAGTPWRASGSLDPLAVLDMTTWAALLGLLDECPVITAALQATVASATGAVSPSDFDFISTLDQLDEVRGFLDRLPEILRS